MKILKELAMPSGSPNGVYDFDVDDVAYLHHGDDALLMRLYRPRGRGPFPTVIELHGGVWTDNDRTRGVVHHEHFARSGIAVAALDFRQGPNRYYDSLIDINYAIRWIKAHAHLLNGDPERVAITGSSSGGHLAMLAAMRPSDPRYAALKLDDQANDFDASVRCAALFWPVINPFGRQKNAIRLNHSAAPAAWTSRTIDRSMGYWGSEEAMREGSPLLIVERGEPVVMPPVLWIQGTNDLIHDYIDPSSESALSEAQRFVARYRAAGGYADLQYFDAPLHFTTERPHSLESATALRMVTNFIHTHTLPVP